MNLHKFKAVGTGAVQMQLKAQRVYYRQGLLSGGATDDTIIIQSQGGGEYLILRPGEGSDLDGDVSDWLISNASGVGVIDGQLIFGKGSYVSNRMTGSVEVIDGGRNRTNGGVAFTASVAVNVANTYFPHAQIFNPVGSGKQLVISEVEFMATIATEAAVAFHNTLLVTNGQGAGVGLNVTPKKQGFASVALVRGENRVGLATNTDRILNPILGANLLYRKKFNEPVVLAPGQGIVAMTFQPSALISFGVEYFEEAAQA